MCDGLEAAKRQKSAQALAATIVIRNMRLHYEMGNHTSVCVNQFQLWRRR